MTLDGGTIGLGPGVAAFNPPVVVTANGGTFSARQHHGHQRHLWRRAVNSELLLYVGRSFALADIRGSGRGHDQYRVGHSDRGRANLDWLCGRCRTLAVCVGVDGWQSNDIDNLFFDADFASGATLGIDTSNACDGFTYSGSIADSSAGPLNVAIFGGNSLTLSGNNSYTGTTTVAAGSLYLGTSDALSSSTIVDLSGGNLNLDGYATVVGGLSGSDPAVGFGLTFGGAQLTIDTSGPETYSGTLYGGGQLIVAGSAANPLRQQ